MVDRQVPDDPKVGWRSVTTSIQLDDGTVVQASETEAFRHEDGFLVDIDVEPWPPDEDAIPDEYDAEVPDCAATLTASDGSWQRKLDTLDELQAMLDAGTLTVIEENVGRRPATSDPGYVFDQ